MSELVSLRSNYKLVPDFLFERNFSNMNTLSKSMGWFLELSFEEFDLR